MQTIATIGLDMARELSCQGSACRRARDVIATVPAARRALDPQHGELADQSADRSVAGHSKAYATRRTSKPRGRQLRVQSVHITVHLRDSRFSPITKEFELAGEFWSEWQDLNLRPPRPERCDLLFAL